MIIWLAYLALKAWLKRKWRELCEPKVIMRSAGPRPLCVTCAGYDPECVNVGSHW